MSFHFTRYYTDPPTDSYDVYIYSVKADIHLIIPLMRRSGLLGNVVGRINQVNRRRARLVLGWVTVCRRVNHLGM